MVCLMKNILILNVLMYCPHQHEQKLSRISQSSLYLLKYSIHINTVLHISESSNGEKINTDRKGF